MQNRDTNTFIITGNFIHLLRLLSGSYPLLPLFLLFCLAFRLLHLIFSHLLIIVYFIITGKSYTCFIFYLVLTLYSFCSYSFVLSFASSITSFLFSSRFFFSLFLIYFIYQYSLSSYILLSVSLVLFNSSFHRCIFLSSGLGSYLSNHI